METNTRIFKLQPIDWQWVLMGYCFFVVFHLLPSFLMLGAFAGGLSEIGWPLGAWFFGGLVIVGYFIGYKSRGVTIIEPAIASVLYTLTLLLEFSQFSGHSLTWRNAAWAYVWFVLVLLLTIVGAWLGELAQARLARKMAQQPQETSQGAA
jgi:hypothetical protein